MSRSGSRQTSATESLALLSLLPAVTKLDQVVNSAMRLNRVPHRQVAVDVVAIASSEPGDFQIAAFFQFGDDALYRTFRDVDLYGHVAHPDFRVGRDAKENVSMVAQERPRGHCPAFQLVRQGSHSVVQDWANDKGDGRGLGRAQRAGAGLFRQTCLSVSAAKAISESETSR